MPKFYVSFEPDPLHLHEIDGVRTQPSSLFVIRANDRDQAHAVAQAYFGAHYANIYDQASAFNLIREGAFTGVVSL